MSIRSCGPLLVGLALVSTLLGVPAAAGSGDGAPASAEAQLDAAKAVRRQAIRKTGEEKRTILEKSAAAYREVLERFPAEKAACAEAAFRVGELERSLGNLPAAEAAFGKASGFKEAAPRFAARAWLELGHLARRAGKADDAVRAYERVLEEHAGETGVGVQALTWIGKVEDRRGRREQACAVWLSLGERFPTQPVAAIRAADLAALSCLAAGERAEAERIVGEVRARFGGEGPDRASGSPEIEEALERMKAARRLEGGSSADDPDDGG